MSSSAAEPGVAEQKKGMWSLYHADLNLLGVRVRVRVRIRVRARIRIRVRVRFRVRVRVRVRHHI